MYSLICAGSGDPTHACLLIGSQVCACNYTIPAVDRLLRPITSSKVLYLGALIETYYPLDRRITLTQDEAFLQARSALEPERDY